MCRNTCLSLSCKTYLSYDAIYLPKVSQPLALIQHLVNVLKWAMYMGRNASLVKIITSMKSTWFQCVLWHSPPNKSASWLFKKSKFGASFLRIFSICFSDQDIAGEGGGHPSSAVSHSPAVNVLLGSILASSLVAHHLSWAFASQTSVVLDTPLLLAFPAPSPPPPMFPTVIFSSSSDIRLHPAVFRCPARPADLLGFLLLYLHRAQDLKI